MRMLAETRVTPKAIVRALRHVRATATLESRRFAWMLMSDGFAVVVAQALVRPTGPPLGPAGWQSHLRTSTTLEGEAMATGSSPEIIATSRLFLEVSLSTVVFPRPRAAAEVGPSPHVGPVSYTHLRAHETRHDLV